MPFKLYRKSNIKREKLLEILIANKTTHIQEYEELLAEYYKNKLEVAQAYVEALKKDPDARYQGPLAERPRLHAKDYDIAISMMQNEVDEVIELTSEEYTMLVMDEWGWSADFRNTKAAYMNNR